MKLNDGEEELIGIEEIDGVKIVLLWRHRYVQSVLKGASNFYEGYVKAFSFRKGGGAWWVRKFLKIIILPSTPQKKGKSPTLFWDV